MIGFQLASSFAGVLSLLRSACLGAVGRCFDAYRLDPFEHQPRLEGICVAAQTAISLRTPRSRTLAEESLVQLQPVRTQYVVNKCSRTPILSTGGLSKPIRCGL